MHTFTSFEQLRQFRENRRTCVTIGVFDGVHTGHQQLIESTVSKAKADGTISTVITFTNHPLSVLAPPYCPKALLTLDRKLERIAALGVDAAIAVPFTNEFAAIEPTKFIGYHLKECAGIARIICGYDFTFGHKGTGTFEVLKSFADDLEFSITQIGPVEHGKIPVKSTHIRDLLAEGKVRRAADLLTRPHELSGVVVSGNARGRQIGFPTANMEFNPDIQLPARGVYICAARSARSGKLHPAMVNIGFNPTFGENQLSVEAHLLEFSQDISGQNLDLYFLERTRDEQRFASVEDLIEQLQKDRSTTDARWASGEFTQLIETIPPSLG